MVNQIILGNALDILKTLPDKSVNCCVTSPPYWNLRDYGVAGQLGLEPTPEEYVSNMVEVFREVKRVLRDDGTLWLNIGDCYAPSAPGTMGDNIHIEGTKEATKRARKIMRPQIPEGLKPKDLVGIPWRLAFALQANGWYLRSDIIWHKPSCMPEAVKDRPTKAHEYLFLLSKARRYYYDYEAIKEKANWPGGSWARSKCYDDDTTGKLRSFYGNGAKWEGSETRNKRTVWTVPTKPFSGAHFATFPPKLIEPCILAGCPEGGIVLDPFMGAGTTALVAIELSRNYIGIELNPEYIKIAENRLKNIQMNLNFFTHSTQ
ncbi:DNA-methyltransferase [Phosphitispora fastidiosa]|uniref:DNA-methyltransferase n=1 Tax=Phosphitispora fastidiosa TaxID=2837202 RepID=UPI001E567163|nr:site-specific DNA-methyltransferase [Phosphitispora fastidiosa]MBU7006340.1 DNA modification methylase [Phosphitispora fastidiosa]